MDAVIGIDFGTVNCRTALVRDREVEPLVNRFHNRPFPLGVEFPVPSADSDGEPVRFRGWKQRLGMDGLAPDLASLGDPKEHVREVFSHLQEDATDAAGMPVDGAVAGVPGCFSDRQRSALKEALEAGGFRTAKLLDESLAATLGAQHLPSVTNVLVFALGAGVFCVSVVQAGHPLRVLATEGVRSMGGLDFDAALIGWILTKLSLNRADFLDRVDAALALRALCERVKLGLSKRLVEEFDLQCPALFADAPPGPSRVSLKITRAEFEERIRQPIDQAMDITRRVIQDAGLRVGGLDGVLLVGGATRSPIIEQRLSQELGIPIWQSQDTGIARGAALYARSLDRSVWKGVAAPVPAPAAAPVPEMPAAELPGKWARQFGPKLTEAEMLWVRGERKSSIDAFEDILNDARSFLGNLRHQWGESLFREGKYMEAVAVLEQVVRENPGDSFARESYHHSLNRRAHQLYAAGQLTEARQAIRLGLALKLDCLPCQNLAQKIDQAVQSRERDHEDGKRSRKGRRR